MTTDKPAMDSSRKALDDFIQGKSKTLNISSLTPEDYVAYLDWERKRRGLDPLPGRLRHFELARQSRGKPLPDVMELRDLIEREYPHTAPIVGDAQSEVIPDRGLTLLAAHPKVGKSLLALQLAVAVARGEPILDFPTQPCRVLYVDAEVKPHSIKKRYLKMRVSKDGPEERDVIFHSVWGQPCAINTEPGRDLIEAAIYETRPQLVILDPFRRLFRGQERDMHDVQEFLAILAEWRRIYAIAILLNHHLRKPLERDKALSNLQAALYEISGTGLLISEPDTVVAMTGSPGTLESTLVFACRDGGGVSPMVIERDSETLLYRRVMQAIENEHSSALELLLAAPLTKAQWRDALVLAGKSRATAYRLINDCLRARYVSGDEPYRIDPEVRAALLRSNSSPT